MLQTEHFSCVSLCITALESLAKKIPEDFMSYYALRVAAEGGCEIPTWIKDADVPLIEAGSVMRMESQVVTLYYTTLRSYQRDETVVDLSGIPCTEAGEFPFISLCVIADTVSTLLMSRIGLRCFPNCVAKFPTLMCLDLSHNSLSELPADLAERCPAVVKLNLSNNTFKAFPPCVLQMRKLEELNLSSNRLEYVPTTLSMVASLRALDVSHNMLKTMISTAATANLHYVKCDENPFLQR
jgi:Leucine-rich repeat (LRR) protein